PPTAPSGRSSAASRARGRTSASGRRRARCISCGWSRSGPEPRAEWAGPTRTSVRCPPYTERPAALGDRQLSPRTPPHLDHAGEESTMDQRTQALDAALTQIERQFGKGSIMKLGDESHVPAAAIPTGCLSLDIALGIGGVPRGRVVEVFGPESSGKTTLVYHVIAEAQKRGGIAAFIDAEHAMDPTYAKRIGVNIDDLLVSQPDTGEQALEIAELLIRSGALDVVAVDSVA